ncbi:hypothetical protein [Arthrobacter sp. MDT1-65]
MPGLRILIPATGPGTGPSIPLPLHSYGRTDAKHRYVASRISDPVGTVVNLWKDEIGTANYVTPAGSTQTLKVRSEAGGFKSVAQSNVALTTGQVQSLTRPADSAVQTVIQVFLMGTNTASRNLFLSGRQWRTFIGSTNGPGLATIAGSGGTGIVSRPNGEIGAGIEIMGATMSTSGAGKLAMLNDAGVSGTFTLGAASGTDRVFATETTALDARILEHLEFDADLSMADMQTVMTSLASHYGL